MTSSLKCVCFLVTSLPTTYKELALCYKNKAVEKVCLMYDEPTSNFGYSPYEIIQFENL